MARALGRIGTGKWSRFAVVLFWLVVVAAAGPLAGKLTGVEKNEAKSWLPGSAESTQVLAAESRFTSPNTLPAVLVYTRPGGLTRPDLAKAAADARAFGRFGSLDGKVVGPVPSRDGQAAQTVIPLNLGSNGWSKAGTEVDRIRAIATTGAAGMTVHVTGPAGSAADSSKAFAGIDSTLLYATVGVVVVILLFTYRSPMLWVLPVVSAGVALAVAQGVIYLLARYAHLTVNAQSAGILTVLVFGAGTDYALLLIARYREELRRHEQRREAMAVALHRAGPAILASGSTVMLGMLCLLVAETNSTRGLGPVAAIGVFVALAVMLTLLPALLVIVGRWVFWPARPRYGSDEPTSRGLWARTGARIARRPRRTWVITALVLAALSVGLVTLDATGLTNAQSFRGHPDSVAGEQALAAHFPAGAGSPVVVVANSTRAAAVRAAFAGTPGIDAATVTPPISRGGIAYLRGTLTSAPDSQAAYDTVDRARARVHAVPGAHAQVGGNTAVNLDVQRAAVRDRNLIIPIVLAVVFVILALLLRAVLGPLILIGTVVLSFAAALGASALVFRYVFGFGGADASLPLFVFVFLVALGIDYNIFLMTRVREESARVGTRRAAVVGLAATGGVITSAGLVLAGTFAVLATLPLTAFAEIGFAVALGVLLDTIVVRSILVTALNLDIGRRIWWPGRLSREPEAGPVEPVGSSSRTLG
ncbi:putative membrane protein ActII-3 [Actinocatenispora thailandica]|uniref:Putative membrane protein ActII-3 n=1 Tax=Actinocatenispora thailandica TaxID=227318 RepID=A0A7R7DT11_9ACTN|nr:MMPL family transporter [Actinocatenispora thailandica]BCJ37273.1 putative membrane protein ActII-3 [Actinocatenispora thailandica]